MTIAIASESCHFYDVKGNPCYTVIGKIGKNGEERNATLADARKNGWYPSVTEIMKIYPKPFLAEWKINQHIHSALTIPHFDRETSDDLIARIKEDAKAQAKKAMEKGTSIHAAIEKYLTSGLLSVEKEYQHFATTAYAELLRYLGVEENMESEAEKSFASPLGYGGKIDLHSKKINFICDFKTKEFSEDIKILSYDEHKIQLIAYANGLEMPDARLINVFISTNNPGLVKVIEHTDNREYYMDVFIKTFELWKSLKKYIPGIKAIEKKV